MLPFLFPSVFRLYASQLPFYIRAIYPPPSWDYKKMGMQHKPFLKAPYLFIYSICLCSKHPYRMYSWSSWKTTGTQEVMSPIAIGIGFPPEMATCSSIRLQALNLPFRPLGCFLLPPYAFWTGERDDSFWGLAYKLALAGLFFFFFSFIFGEQTMIVVFVDTPLIELESLSSLMIGRECG